MIGAAVMGGRLTIGLKVEETTPRFDTSHGILMVTEVVGVGDGCCAMINCSARGIIYSEYHRNSTHSVNLVRNLNVSYAGVGKDRGSLAVQSWSESQHAVSIGCLESSRECSNTSRKSSSPRPQGTQCTRACFLSLLRCR